MDPKHSEFVPYGSVVFFILLLVVFSGMYLAFYHFMMSQS
jgi:uncharacterized membrane protein